MTSPEVSQSPHFISPPVAKIRSTNRKRKDNEPERIPMLRMRGVLFQQPSLATSSGRTNSSASSNSNGSKKVKCPSMDSGVSNRYRSTESEGSSPALYLRYLKDLDDVIEAEYQTERSMAGSREDDVINSYPIDVTNTKERYKTTASDKDADKEVSEILSAGTERNSSVWNPSYDADNTYNDITNNDCDVKIFHAKQPTNNVTSPKQQMPLFRHRREIGELLHTKERNNNNGQRRYNTNSHTIYDVNECHNGEQPDLLRNNVQRSPAGISSGPESSRANSALTLTDTDPERDDVTSRENKKKGSKKLRHSKIVKSASTMDANGGVSSNDTHRSSVRYEPVVTDHSCTPPSPGRHGSRHKLLGNKKASSKHRPARTDMTDDDVTDEERNDDIREDDDIASMDDVIRSEELRPLNSRRRMSSPVIEQHVKEQYNGRRESSTYLARTNSGTVYVTKGGPTTLPTEPRHQVGLPRMGTGLPPSASSVTSQSTVPIGPSTSMYKPQPPTSLVTSRIPSSQTDQYDPVVMTTLQTAHEGDQSGWSYRGVQDARQQYPFSSGVQAVPHMHAATTPNGEDTTVRFMSKRPSIAAAYTAGRHISNSQFEPSSFKGFKNKISSGCSWKCACIFFIFLCVLLVAVATYFIVQSLAVSEPINTTDAKCMISTSSTNPPIIGKPGDALEIQLGRKARFSVLPGTFWRSLVFMGDDGHLKFNFTVNRRAVLGIYGRKGLEPSHTKYDFFEQLDGSTVPVTSQSSSGGTSKRRKRDIATKDQVTLNFVQFLDSGSWHLAVYNDGDAAEEVEILTKIIDGISSCPNNCNGNGDCINGICKCFPRFQGRECSEVSCPVVCSGRGLYAHGSCVCFSGWKGRDCSIPTDQCEVKDCSGHGTCGRDGECECNPGWTGPGCETATCLSPTCSDHGVCVKGNCHCDRGWKGQLCEEEDSGCFEQCSGHGSYNEATKQCVCDAGWNGRDCSKVPCLPTCHPDHGTCISGQCHCNEGWTGRACNERMCQKKCYQHGTCSNGQCLCNMGWNGDMCTIVGCSNNCGSHGHCTKDRSGLWVCSCQLGWKGKQCNVEVELQCGDGKDNDRDTLVDCQDPDCCSQAQCQASSDCRGADDPVVVLSRTTSRARRYPTLPFYDRIRFLTQSTSRIQILQKTSVFKPKETSVLRGQVVSLDGSPLVGVTVTIAGRTDFGYTKTRSDGWYDIMVNGGGSLSLMFDRSSSFLTSSVSIFVPLNDFVIVPTVTMRTHGQPDQLRADVTMSSMSCDVSAFPRPQIVVLPTEVRAFTADNCEDRGSIIPETQAVRETIDLPSSGVDLVYLSSRTSDHKSKLEIKLTSLDVASNLNKIYLWVSIQGVLFEKIFEPLPDLKYVFIWDRLDAYREKVYGTVTAKVKVGYEYEMCPSIVWDTQLTTVEGHNPVLTQAVGGWTFSIHHTFHADKGIVQLGNSGMMKLSEQPPMMSTIMGDGKQRHRFCDKCSGPAIDGRLMAPVSLSCDSVGNVFIGDHNYIRKIDIDGQVSSLLYLRSPPHKYYMATSPTIDGILYYSDPNGKRIYRIRNMEPRGSRKVLSAADLSSNMEVVAGTGTTCLPLEKGNCGDNGPAHAAKLSGPQGLAVDKDGRIYFVDGTKIRIIEKSGVIHTFAGSDKARASRPLPCESSMSLEQLQLDFPTDLTINPVDGSLFVLDTDVVVRIDVTNLQVSLAAGIPVHCARKAARSFDDRDARKTPLISPISITVSPRDGSLYVAESDNGFVNRVRRVDTYRHRISTVAGEQTDCDCAMSDCECFKGDGDFARSARMNTLAAVAASPDGSIYVADQLNARIRKISQTLPKLNTRNQYKVANPDLNLVYVFSRQGLHLTTQNVITGTTVYNFTYSPDGLLNSIIDVNGNRLSIIRNSNEEPRKIVLPNRKIFELQFNSDRTLQRIVEEYSSPLAAFTYQGDESSLLKSITRGRSSSSFYVYNVYGRLISATSPSGGVTSLFTLTNSTTHTVTMEAAATSPGSAITNDLQIGVGARAVVIATQPGYLCDIVTTTEGDMKATYKRWTDNSISVHFLDGSELSLETKPHPVLGLTAPFLAKRTIHLPQDPLENNIEWRTRKQLEATKEESYLLGRRMRVNGRNVLSLDFSQNYKMEKIYDDHTKFMLKIMYNDRGLPTLWMPSNGVTPVNVTYDRPGHATTWQRGPNHARVQYDEKGRVTSRRTADGAVWLYVNRDNVVQLSLTGSRSRYTFTYDNFENVRRVSLSSGATYIVTRFMGIGFKRTKIENQDMKLTLDYDDKDKIMTKSYEGEGRKVVYRYDTHGHLTEVLHDMQRTRLLRDPGSGELVSMATDDCVTRFQRNGPLVQQLTMTSSDSGTETSAKFEFTYDENLRLKSSRAAINGTALRTENLKYDDVSGKVTAFGQYSVLYYRINMYLISTTEIEYRKQLDSNGRTEELKYDIYRNSIFHLSVEYDVMGRVTGQNQRIGMYGNETQYKYMYNKDGSLASVESGQKLWKYTYDSDDRLSEIQIGRSITKIRYNSRGRVTSCGSLQYSFDKDGLLRTRGFVVFEYNSLGHLVAAYRRDGLFKMQYGYDGFGRLSSRFDELTEQTIRFYYSDINNPTRVSHYYNSTSDLISTLRYDMEGILFAMEISDGRTWLINCDNNGSPLAVITGSGFLLKEIKYSAFGEIKYDSNPQLQLVIGYRGGIYDAATELVHFAERSMVQQRTNEDKFRDPNGFFAGVDYDPLIAQTTTPDYSMLMRKRERLPQPFKPYQILDPVNPVPPYNQMTQVSSWLNALGFKLQNVAPDPKINDRQKDKSSVECQLSHHLQTYINLQTAANSDLVPEYNKGKKIPNGALFAQGLVLSVDRGKVSTHVISTATDDVKRLSSILNGGDVIVGKTADSPSAPMSLTLEEKPIIYISKSFSSLKTDKFTLRLQNTVRSLDGGYSDLAIKEGSSSSQKTAIKVSLRDNTLQAESSYAVVMVSYVTDDNSNGKTKKSEEKKILELAKKRAESRAWELEKRKLDSNQRTQWSVQEKQELRTSGKVRGYKVELFWDVDKYPEFADSGRNCKFVTT